MSGIIKALVAAEAKASSEREDLRRELASLRSSLARAEGALLEWAKRRVKFLGTDDPEVVAKDRAYAEEPLVRALAAREREGK